MPYALALFDCTPRMNKAKENNVSVMDVADRGIAQNDSRSILRRGTAEGVIRKWTRSFDRGGFPLTLDGTTFAWAKWMVPCKKWK